MPWVQGELAELWGYHAFNLWTLGTILRRQVALIRARNFDFISWTCAFIVERSLTTTGWRLGEIAVMLEIYVAVTNGKRGQFCIWKCDQWLILFFYLCINSFREMHTFGLNNMTDWIPVMRWSDNWDCSRKSFQFTEDVWQYRLLYLS